MLDTNDKDGWNTVQCLLRWTGEGEIVNEDCKQNGIQFKIKTKYFGVYKMI